MNGHARGSKKHIDLSGDTLCRMAQRPTSARPKPENGADVEHPEAPKSRRLRYQVVIQDSLFKSEQHLSFVAVIILASAARNTSEYSNPSHSRRLTDPS